MVPLVLLASTLQTLIAAFAKSYREAQTYLSLLMLLPMIPSAMLAVLPLKAQKLDVRRAPARPAPHHHAHGARQAMNAADIGTVPRQRPRRRRPHLARHRPGLPQRAAGDFGLTLVSICGRRAVA